MLIGAGPLSGVLGLPETLLRIAGLVLLPYAGFIGWLGMRETINKPVAWAVVLGNALWVADSLLLLVSGWIAPTSAGYAFVIGQELVVLMYAGFIAWLGMR